MPDVALTDGKGLSCQLWDFRNRSHVGMVVLPLAEGASLAAWLALSTEHQKTWEWLGVKFFGAAPSPLSLEPGVYAIDRYGGFIGHVPFGPELWERIEKEFLYYEAKHC